jgi:hypothetical protein
MAIAALVAGMLCLSGALGALRAPTAQEQAAFDAALTDFVQSDTRNIVTLVRGRPSCIPVI